MYNTQPMHFPILNIFLKISDIHLSSYRNGEARKSDLKKFVSDHLLTVIKPEVVIASGELKVNGCPGIFLHVLYVYI